jgi:hypothetical protein
MENSNQSSSEQDILFCGLTLRCTVEQFNEIKQFILTQTAAKLMCQTKSPFYLKIEEVERKESENKRI